MTLALPWPVVGSAVFKQQPEDFQVEEQLPFPLEGEGEHLWLWVEKRGQNTQWVARQLAQWADISPRDVGYAGQKDRQAMTRQWFSLWLPGRTVPSIETCQIAGVKVLRACRHRRKLQTGALSANRFDILLREVDADQEAVSERLQLLQQRGMPNYFGPQRFGHAGQNVASAWHWLVKGGPKVAPALRRRHLSVLRSLAFNGILNRRVREDCWDRPLPGEVFQLAGSSRCFVDDGSADLPERVRQGDIHPTGALPGLAGKCCPFGEAAERESAVLADWPDPEQVWTRYRVWSQRRALRAFPEGLHWQWEAADRLRLRFYLPAGSYASVLLAQVFALRQPVPEVVQTQEAGR